MGARCSPTRPTRLSCLSSPSSGVPAMPSQYHVGLSLLATGKEDRSGFWRQERTREPRDLSGSSCAGAPRTGQQPGDTQVLICGGPVYPFTVPQELPVRPGRRVRRHQSGKPREWNDDASAICQIDAQLVISHLDPASERAQFRAGRTHTMPPGACRGALPPGRGCESVHVARTRSTRPGQPVPARAWQACHRPGRARAAARALRCRRRRTDTARPSERLAISDSRDTSFASTTELVGAAPTLPFLPSLPFPPCLFQNRQRGIDDP